MRWLEVGGLVGIVVLALGIGQTGFGHAVLRKAGLLEDTPSYTSLAFAHPQSLQERRDSVDVTFVIHNSGAPRDYQWSVLLAQGRSARRVAEGNVYVAPGHGASITRSENILCTRGQVQIVVSLARPAEQIDAWAACPSAKSSLQRQKDA